MKNGLIEPIHFQNGLMVGPTAPGRGRITSYNVCYTKLLRTTNIRTTHYILGSVLGAHPYPMMIRDFQSIIGKEARKQMLAAEGRLPDCLIACVGGGSNAMGLFHAFIGDKKVKMSYNFV